jgi:hypothetical protein
MQSKSYQEALRFFRASPAYQEAVFQLLVGEAKWIADAVGIHDPIGGDPRNVAAPAEGIGGILVTTNYTLAFSHGRLYSLRWHDWLRKIEPPVTDMLEFAKRPSQLDNDSALELARSWLTNLGVDMSALAAKSSPTVFHVPALSVRDTPPGEPRPMRPQFIIKWPGPPRTTLPDGRPLPPRIRALPGQPLITVEILGTTKQPIEVTIHDPQLWSRPSLELKNAAELLGAEPTPAELMARILTPATFAAIENPETMQAALLTSNASEGRKKDRLGPIKLDPALAKKVSAALLDFDSYNSWSAKKGCMTDDGVRLQIKRGANEVEVWFCFECDILRIVHGGVERWINFDQGHDRFADLFLEAFPNDAVLRGIPRKPKF